jgi:RNA polymerase sigma-70 factor (ECF subfamily)
MTDAELDHLFASCMPRLRQTARQMLRNPQDCEDALQEGLLLAFRNLNQFQGRSKFSTWLHSIVRNAARTHVRKTKCRPQCSWEEFSNGRESTVERLIVDPGPAPDEKCALRERSHILLELVQELPSKYHSVMRLCDVEGVEPKAAAQRLGITVSAVKTYLFRARRLVTKRIRERCVPRFKRFSGHDISPFQGTRVSESSEQVRSVGCPKRSESESCRLRTRASKKTDLQRGNHESRRKRPRIWNNHVAPFVRATLCSDHHSAC